MPTIDVWARRQHLANGELAVMPCGGGEGGSREGGGSDDDCDGGWGDEDNGVDGVDGVVGSF